MKTAYYVATVVSAYRHALDLLAEEGEATYRRALPALLAELDKASHRPFNTGFYFGAPTPAAQAGGCTQSMEFVAEVAQGAAAGEEAELIVKNRFYVGDRLEALTPAGSRAFVAGPIILTDTGAVAETVSVAGTRVKLRLPFAVGPGDLLRGENRNHRGPAEGPARG